MYLEVNNMYKGFIINKYGVKKTVYLKEMTLCQKGIIYQNAYIEGKTI